MPFEDSTFSPRVPVSANEAERRFEFGRNWRAFLPLIDECRIGLAEQSLREMLRVEDLSGQRFLDAGSGSGLFSLAARRLGATVVSFDYDPQAVACASELRQRFAPAEHGWRIEQGSVLDENYLESLGEFDVVYSWGVLHHTGRMWQALDNVQRRVVPGGLLYIALYNDEGARSQFWTRVKRLYVSGAAGRAIILGLFVPLFATKAAIQCILQWRNAFADYARTSRGMSMYRDWIDWLGGYPFEVARPEEVLSFLRIRGHVLENLKTTNRLGCNEYVFHRQTDRTG